jgi:peptidoglycan/LPS O-acetylase OafA/YrhL
LIPEIGSSLSHPKYRADIDGLRAIAVLAVVAFHSFPSWLKGGFIGVDVFFVISGYLISTIIFDSLDKGVFSFFEFYSRRISRIFPALILVLIACFVFGWLALLADEYKQLGKHMAAGTGFVSNLILWSESGYFDNAAETKPLLHLWSLGIEEQFYIVWPLLLWLAWKRKLNLFTITSLVALASFALNLKGVSQDLVATFYSPQTRFWELLSGSLLAWLTLYQKSFFANLSKKVNQYLCILIYREKQDTNGQSLANLLSFIGLLLLTYGFWRINKDLIYPGKWALVPVVGTMLLLMAGPKAWINHTLLSNRVIVEIGLISYPLYLWHWPILAYIKIVEGEVPSVGVRATAVLLSIILAWLTYKLLEKPLRSSATNYKKIISLIVFMFATGCIGLITYKSSGLKFRVDNFIKISEAAGEWEFPGKLMPFTYEGKTFYRQNSGKKSITLFVGDSNTEQYYARVNQVIADNPADANSVVFAVSSGCLAIPSSPFNDGFKSCNGLIESALKYSENELNIRTVVISSLWSMYLLDGKALDGEFGFGSQNYRVSLQRLSEYIKKLKLRELNVFLILEIPHGDEFDPKFMVQRSFKNFPSFLTIKEGGMRREIIEAKFGNLYRDLSDIARKEGAILISPLDYLCDLNYCPSRDKNGEPTHFNGGHLNPKYVRFNVSYIDEVMFINGNKVTH